MELNITTQEQVKRRVDALKWSIITRDEALETLRETESEVLSMLVSLKHYKSLFCCMSLLLTNPTSLLLTFDDSKPNCQNTYRLNNPTSRNQSTNLKMQLPLLPCDTSLLKSCHFV